jgi:hypothetical protein
MAFVPCAIPRSNAGPLRASRPSDDARVPAGGAPRVRRWARRGWLAGGSGVDVARALEDFNHKFLPALTALGIDAFPSPPVVTDFEATDIAMRP